MFIPNLEKAYCSLSVAVSLLTLLVMILHTCTPTIKSPSTIANGLEKTLTTSPAQSPAFDQHVSLKAVIQLLTNNTPTTDLSHSSLIQPSILHHRHLSIPPIAIPR